MRAFTNAPCGLYDGRAQPPPPDVLMLTLRIFIASPGDVAGERRLAIETIRELEDSHLLRDRVNLQVVAWDDPAARAPMDARETPQRSVQRYARRPADCDLTLVVLWSRMGTPLPGGMTRADGSRFASGTVWEVEDALAADRPVFVYRRTEKPRIEVDDPQFDAKRAQFETLGEWFAAFERGADGTLRAGINDYATPAEFRLLLRQHLEAFIGQRLDEARSDATTPVREPRLASAPAPVPNPWPAPVPRSPSPRASLSRWGLPAAGAALVVAALLAWKLWPSSAPMGKASAPATGAPAAAGATSPPATVNGSTARTAPPAPAAAKVVPHVRVPDNREVRFVEGNRPTTFTLLAASASHGTSTHWTLTLRLRMTLPDSGGDANFWDSSFRLLQDGVPRAPNSTLNEIVRRGASKDGELTYEVPHGTQSLVLRVWHYSDSADLPLVVESAGPPAVAFAYPPGPRRVVVEGPPEVTFTRVTRIAYKVLATGTEARRPGVLGLRIRLRMMVFDSGGGANFWDSSFRLVVDGDPLTPDSNLNEVVAPRAAKDGDISFELPEAARTVVLHIRRSDAEVAELPLRLEAAR